MMEANVFLGTFNAGEMYWYPSPGLCLNRILSRSSTDNFFDLTAWFLLWHALSTVGPYIDRCVPFQIMSNQLNLPQVDSNRHLKDDQWKQDAPENAFNAFAKMSKFVFTLSLWGIVCRLLRI